jgi:hypothetical protein
MPLGHKLVNFFFNFYLMVLRAKFCLEAALWLRIGSTRVLSSPLGFVFE